MKKLLSATLALAMLASTPLAGASEVAPSDLDTDSISGTYDPRNTTTINGQTVFLSSLSRLSLLQQSGIATQTTTDDGTARILLSTGENEADALLLNTDESTRVLDAQTGDSKTLADIVAGDAICAYVSAATTMSIPPQSYAELILVNLDAEASIPMYAEIDGVNPASNSTNVILTTDMDYNFVVTDETQISPYLTRQLITKDTLIPGQKVLAWYSSVQETSPAQAEATRLLVFPSSYDGYLTLRDSSETTYGELYLNGELLSFTTSALPYISSDTYNLPLRKIAEALGYTVTWDNETKTATLLTSDGTEHAMANTAQNSVTIRISDDTFSSTTHAGVRLQDGVSYVDLDLAIRMLNLKLVLQ